MFGGAVFAVLAQAIFDRSRVDEWFLADDGRATAVNFHEFGPHLLFDRLVIELDHKFLLNLRCLLSCFGPLQHGLVKRDPVLLEQLEVGDGARGQNPDPTVGALMDLLQDVLVYRL